MSKINCKECGLIFIKKCVHQKFCSPKCRLRWNNNIQYENGNRDKYFKSEEYKLHKKEYDEKYRIENKEKKRKSDKNWYEKNKESCIRKSKEYKINNRDKYNAWYRKRNKDKPERSRENCALQFQFGKVSIDPNVRKDYAIIHLARRAFPFSHIKPINKSKIPEIIKKVNKGETYEAYK